LAVEEEPSIDLAIVDY